MWIAELNHRKCVNIFRVFITNSFRLVFLFWLRNCNIETVMESMNSAHYISSNEGNGITKNSYLISGITFVVSFMALLLCIISTAVPQWATYSDFLTDYSFGPFQQCDVVTSICSRNQIASTFIIVAGAFGVLTILSLCCLVSLSIIHITIENRICKIMCWKRMKWQMNIVSRLLLFCSLSTFLFFGSQSLYEWSINWQDSTD